MAKIAIFIPDLRGGGAERVALTLVKGFVDRGHAVDLVVMQAEGELLKLLPAKASIVDLNVERIRSSLWPLAHYIRQQRPDALLALMWPLTVVAVIAKLITRSSTRIGVSDHGVLSEHYSDQPGTLATLRLTARFLYPLADVRIAPSRGISVDLQTLAALERDSIEVIPNPLSIPTDPVARNEEIDSLWGDASVHVLSVGALKPEKNHKLLLEAFADFARERDARLIIVGEGPLRPELEELADQMGIAERVCLPGFRADPWPFYASAHLFVLTSQSEGFGNVLVEAMAAGLPIVSTDCAGPREILDGGKWGALVPVGDRGALTHAMAQSIDVPIDRDSLRARARQYSPDMISNSYLAALLGSGQLKADRS